MLLLESSAYRNQESRTLSPIYSDFGRSYSHSQEFTLGSNHLFLTRLTINSWSSFLVFLQRQTPEVKAC